MYDLDTAHERAKLIAEITAIAYLVDECTDYCVFFDFSGHVDTLSISICKSDDSYNDEIASTSFYTQSNDLFSDGSVNRKYCDTNYLLAKRDHLLEILKGADIEEMDL